MIFKTNEEAQQQCAQWQKILFLHSRSRRCYYSLVFERTGEHEWVCIFPIPFLGRPWRDNLIPTEHHLMMVTIGASL